MADKKTEAKQTTKQETEQLDAIATSIIGQEMLAISVFNQLFAKSKEKPNVFSTRIAGRLDSWGVHARLIGLEQRLSRIEKLLIEIKEGK